MGQQQSSNKFSQSYFLHTHKMKYPKSNATLQKLEEKKLISFTCFFVFLPRDVVILAPDNQQKAINVGSKTRGQICNSIMFNFPRVLQSAAHDDALAQHALHQSGITCVIYQQSPHADDCQTGELLQL